MVFRVANGTYYKMKLRLQGVITLFFFLPIPLTMVFTISK